MDTLTEKEMIDLIVALDNEAARNSGKESDKYRDLKWKVFRIMVDMQKKAEA